MRYKISSLHLKYYKFGLTNDKPTIIQGAFISPRNGIVFNKKLKLLHNSIFSDRKIRVLYNFNFFNLKIYFKPVTIIEHGPWDNYYHWYVDSIPRLFWLWDSKIMTMNSVSLLCSKKLNKEEEEILLCLTPPNVRLKYIKPSQTYFSFSFIFLPFLSGSNSANLSDKYLNFFLEKMIENFDLKETKRLKIFISREKASKRKFLNKDAVNKFMMDNGFYVLMLEELSIKEQANYFYNAEIVISQHGAGLTNLLFSKSASVIEIFSSPNFYHNHYKSLCESKGLKYYSFNCSGKNKNSDVILDLMDLKKSFNFLLQPEI
ncbi:MAG: glycosyltransferase family 61 protein [Chitinophagaceae bacterium]|nr:glycosyltransferase family 61 protein [Chitinophagaceae bacterium]